jgi:hypothetical protein
MEPIDAGEEPRRDLPGAPREPEAALDPDGLREALQEALKRLPVNYVGAVRLHYLSGYDTRETARILGLPRTTVKMRLHRARRFLKKAVLRRARFLVLVLALAPAAAAGPLETRELWDHARTLAGRPWRERFAAYRAVVAAAAPSDRYRGRALLAMAGILRDARHVHAAAAAEAGAARSGPEADGDRVKAALALAKGLRAEEDREATAAPLEDVAAAGRAEVPWLADEALDLLGGLAFDARDLDGAVLVARRLAKARAAADVRIVAEGRVGLLRLDAGDRVGALRCLRDAERAFLGAGRGDDAASRRATKAWLDLPLRARLEPDG